MRIKVFDKGIIFSAIISIIVITACVKSHDVTPLTPGTSIAGFVKGASNLTLLDSAMSRAHLFATLDSSSPPYYTLFAPVNIAFTNSLINDSIINSFTDTVLKKILMYHIIGSPNTTYYLANFPKGINSSIASAGGDDLYITVNGSNLFVNGNLVTQADITAKNGVIHALSAVLIPPSGNIFQTLTGKTPTSLPGTTDTTLTFLVAALNWASTGSISLDSLLSNNDSTFTILAPTNAAFRAIGDTTIDVIKNYIPDTLARILQCHLIRGRAFSSDFPQSGTLLSVAGDSLTFSTTFNLTVQSKGDSLSGAANITRVNKMATNGVIHKVDRVLLQ